MYDEEKDQWTENDFKRTLVGIIFALISLPIMFILMFVICDLIAATLAFMILLAIYIGFICIEFIFSKNSPEGLK